jgi:predicted nucleic acid-binding protein
VIIVDTNVLAYLFLQGEHTSQAEAARRQDKVWAAPRLWRSEFRNVLAQYLRRELLTLQDARRMVDRATEMMEGHEYEVSSLYVLELVSQSTCSAYDCEFVALARDLQVPLVTTDRQILREFPSIAVGLGTFLASRNN